MPYSDKMKREYYPKRRISIEEIVFFIFITIIIGTALWLLSGSPPEINAIISVTIAVAASELLIWKFVFNLDKNLNITISKLDKKTAISFIKVKEKLNYMDNKLDNINNKLDKLSK